MNTPVSSTLKAVVLPLLPQSNMALPRLKKQASVILIFAMLFLSIFAPIFLTSKVYAGDPTWLMGLSGYFSGQVGLDEIVDTINANNASLNLFRFSFTPNWKSQVHPYNSTAIQYILDNTDATVVVDRTHLYPPTEASALDARNHWTDGVIGGAYEVLEDFPNNSEIYVELINEYVSSDFDTRMQSLITDIRADGYNNSLVADRMWPFSWTVWTDSENATYQGFHQYMNERPLSTAISRFQDARDAGITKILNTETGAHFNEYGSFTQALVDSLEDFYDWCYSLDAPIFNCLWMREDIENWATYQTYSLNLPTEPPPPVEPPPGLPPYLLSSSVSTTLQYATSTFSATWNATEQLSMGWLYHNKTGLWENVTQALSGTEDTFSTTVVLPVVGFCFGYYFGANDTLGNETESDTAIFTVTIEETDIPYPMPQVRFPSGKTVAVPADRTVYFGSVKVSTSNTAMYITKFFEDSWFNYTVDGSGTQTIYNGSEPEQVLIDGHQYTESNGWTFADSTITVSIATSDVHIFWGSVVNPSTEEEEQSQGGPQTSNSQNVLFITVNGKVRVAGAEITVYEVVENTYQGRYVTGSNGECEAQIYPGSYKWIAVYRGMRANGEFFHVEAETVTIDFATGTASRSPGIDRTALLKYVLAVLAVAIGVIAIVMVTKSRSLRI